MAVKSISVIDLLSLTDINATRHYTGQPAVPLARVELMRRLIRMNSALTSESPIAYWLGELLIFSAERTISCASRTK